jgi:hypothetical protein
MTPDERLREIVAECDRALDWALEAQPARFERIRELALGDPVADPDNTPKSGFGVGCAAFDRGR